MSLPQDILGVIRGLQAVAQAGLKLQEAALKEILRNSSVKTIAEECLSNVKNTSTPDLNKNTGKIVKTLSDTGDRFYTVVDGIKQFVVHATTKTDIKDIPPKAPGSISPETAAKTTEVKRGDLEIKLTPSDKELLKKLDMEYREKIKANATAGPAPQVDLKRTSDKVEPVESRKPPPQESASKTKNENAPKEKEPSKSPIKAVPNPKSKQSD